MEGRVEQYPAYREIRDQIGKPVHEIPGNHDPSDAFSREIRQPIDTVVDHDWLRCILLGNAKRTSHDGFFGDEQLDWLDGTCSRLADDDKLGVIACHVPVHTNKPPDRAWYVKPANGQSRFYEIVDKHRDHLLGIFHGHFHNGIRGWDDRNPVHEICFPSALYNQNRGLEERGAPGYNPVEFRPGYTLVTIGGGKLTIRYKPVGDDVAFERDLKRS